MARRHRCINTRDKTSDVEREAGKNVRKCCADGKTTCHSAQNRPSLPVKPLNPPKYPIMDPLSFTASLIAVVSAAGTLAQQLKLLHSTLRDASSLLSALINEISDLRIVLEACSSAVTELYRTSNTANLPSPLADATTILHRTKGYLEDLEKVILSCFGGSSDPSNISRGVRLRWVREKGKAERLQAKLRDSKQDLLMLLESQSV